jgi:hypothetical protein
LHFALSFTKVLKIKDQAKTFWNRFSIQDKSSRNLILLTVYKTIFAESFISMVISVEIKIYSQSHFISVEVSSTTITSTIRF